MPLSFDIYTVGSIVLQFVYAIGAFGLALYGGQALWLTWKLFRHSSSKANTISQVTISQDLTSGEEASLGEVEWPAVTVQLPVFNEQHVIERLIDACAQLHYPKTRLQIQILDDSTDQTTSLARQRARYWRVLGVNIRVIHRTQRQGYKAGALANALPYATGEFIAILDADFVPSADFLLRIVSPFQLSQNADVGFVQARWGHLNAEYSALTRSQALALDGHFAVEQSARQLSGYPFGFNGSAGIWRRKCIEDARVGGWQIDTLCEDLDLSYRAQLAGWRPLYLHEIVVPAEIPPQLLAFKRQQFRWAKGSVQTLKKLSRAVWRSQWAIPAQVTATLHLGNYLIHPLLLLLLLVTLPLLLLGIDPFWPLTYLSLVSIGPPLLYAVAQRRLYPQDWRRRWSYLPVLTLLGTGLCLSNSVAVWQALCNRPTPFLRTPKFQVRTTQDRWHRSNYALRLEPMMLGEMLLCAYACTTVVVAMSQQNWWTIPFLLIYASGFGYMVAAGLWQAMAARSGSFHRLWQPYKPAHHNTGQHTEVQTEGRTSEIQA